MKHRHLTTKHWSAAAMDSASELGGLEDRCELFAAVRASSELAELVLRVARQRDLGGSSILAVALTERLRPSLGESRVQRLEKSEGA